MYDSCSNISLPYLQSLNPSSMVRFVRADLFHMLHVPLSRLVDMGEMSLSSVSYSLSQKHDCYLGQGRVSNHCWNMGNYFLMQGVSSLYCPHLRKGQRLKEHGTELKVYKLKIYNVHG